MAAGFVARCASAMSVIELGDILNIKTKLSLI